MYRQMALQAEDDTPATRTGPPRSLSFVTGSTSFPTRATHFADRPSIVEDSELSPSAFRSALEYTSPNEWKAKRRREKGKSAVTEEIWSPKKWFQESPKEERATMDFKPESSNETSQPLQPPTSPTLLPKFTSRRPTISNTKPSSTAKAALRRAFSAPHRPPTESLFPKGKEEDKDKDTFQSSVKWAKLRSLLPHIVHPNQSILPGPSVVTSHAVNITDELITGGLSTLMLRLWFERDEKGRRRVPFLFHRLRIRVSDSLHPLQQHQSVFRIECEYANGAARWVIYRELRDFISLHAHYTLSNVYNRIRDKLPEFPMTSTRLILISDFNHSITLLCRLAVFKVSQEGRKQGGKNRLCSYATRGTRELSH